MKNARLSTILILLLILLNSVTLAFMWFGKSPCPPPPIAMHRSHHPEGPGRFIAQELKFDEKQREEFEQLKQTHRMLTRALLDSMHTLKEKLFSGIPQGDMALAGKNASGIASLQKQLELVTFSHFKQVRDLCTDDQKKHFDEIIGHVLEMMAPMPPPPPQEPLPPPHP